MNPLLTLVLFAALTIALTAAMASLRAPRNPRNRPRTRLPQSQQPNISWTATVAANVVTMTFAQNVVTDTTSIPNITVNGVKPLQSANQTGARTVTLTYTAAVSTDTLTVNPGVTEIRGAMGGAIAAGSLELP